MILHIGHWDSAISRCRHVLLALVGGSFRLGRRTPPSLSSGMVGIRRPRHLSGRNKHVAMPTVESAPVLHRTLHPVMRRPGVGFRLRLSNVLEKAQINNIHFLKYKISLH